MIADKSEVISIFLSYQSKKREIVAFLDEMHRLLEGEDFDINTDLYLVRKKKQGDEQKFSTPYTLLDLDYDADPPMLFVFGKDINGKLIYVKVKIRNQKNQVVCVSFHYAKDKMKFPYA